MFLRYLMPLLLGFAAKQLKKKNATTGSKTSGSKSTGSKATTGRSRRR